MFHSESASLVSIAKYLYQLSLTFVFIKLNASYWFTHFCRGYYFCWRDGGVNL